jgi:hypothetical protein
VVTAVVAKLHPSREPALAHIAAVIQPATKSPLELFVLSGHAAPPRIATSRGSRLFRIARGLLRRSACPEPANPTTSPDRGSGEAMTARSPGAV